MKRVLIATPCLDQKVDAYFVHSLCESIRLGLKNNFDIRCIFLANESILPMARNELINLCYKDEYDIMVFIDDDEFWNAADLIEILQSEKDVIAIPVVNKSDTKVGYNIFLKNKSNLVKDDKDGYIVADRVGTGFLKLSRKVVVDLWESNPELVFRGRKLKNVCEYTYVNGDFVGEDITLSTKIKELGYTIWVNPKHTVSHIGNKVYKGNFESSVNE